MKKCRGECKDKACEATTHLKNGCGQMYSCSHGCKMRQLGVDETTCKSKCNRHGASGCSPEVENYKFNLCKECQRVPESEACPNHPTVAECELGCTSYGKNTSGK